MQARNNSSRTLSAITPAPLEEMIINLSRHRHKGSTARGVHIVPGAAKWKGSEPIPKELEA